MIGFLSQWYISLQVKFQQLVGDCGGGEDSQIGEEQVDVGGRRVVDEGVLGGEVLALPQRAGEELELVGQVHLSERVEAHELEALAEDVDRLVELLGAERDGVGADLVDDAAALDDALGAHQDAVDVGHDVADGGVQDRSEGNSEFGQGLLVGDSTGKCLIQFWPGKGLEIGCHRKSETCLKLNEILTFEHFHGILA